MNTDTPELNESMNSQTPKPPISDDDFHKSLGKFSISPESITAGENYIRLRDEENRTAGRDNLIRNHLLGLRIRATEPRMKILRYLYGQKTPQPLDIIRKALEKELHESSLYRNLETLYAANVIFRFDIGQPQLYYEYAFGRKHHHHAICTKCGKIEDFTMCDSLELTALAHASLKEIKNIYHHTLQFFGICKVCNLTTDISFH